MRSTTILANDIPHGQRDVQPRRGRGPHRSPGALRGLPAFALAFAAAIALTAAWAAGGARPVLAASPASGAAPIVTINRPAHGATVCAGKLAVLVDVTFEVRLSSEALSLDGVSVPFTTASDGPGGIDIGANVPVAAGLHTLYATATDANGMLGGDTAEFTVVTCAPGQTQPGKPTATPAKTATPTGGGVAGRSPGTPGPGAAPTPSNPNANPAPQPATPTATITFWLLVVSAFLLAVLLLAGLVALIRGLAGGTKKTTPPNGIPAPGTPTPH